MSESYDLIIVGGGMVGLTLAKALSGTGLRRLVLDSSIPEDEADSVRVSAISRASQHILKALGSWDDTLQQQARAYERMLVTDPKGEGQLEFMAASLSEADLGHIVPNHSIRTALWQSLQDDADVTLLAPVSAESAYWHEEGVTIRVKGMGEYQGRLAVAADGANSWLRRQSAIHVDSSPYEHTALVANIRCQHSHGACARQVFLDDGPLAFLPLVDERLCSIVWSTRPEHATELMALSDQAFNQALQQAFGMELGNLELASQRLSFPLIRRHAQNYVQRGLALVGDAAHTIHPLAGQGVNLGLLDAASLAQVIEKAHSQGLDFAQVQQLRPYERWRRSENQLMLDAMTALKHLFAGHHPMFNRVRGLGMNLINKTGPVKSQLIQRAMGLVGDLPELAKAPMPKL